VQKQDIQRGDWLFDTAPVPAAASASAFRPLPLTPLAGGAYSSCGTPHYRTTVPAQPQPTECWRNCPGRAGTGSTLVDGQPRPADTARCQCTRHHRWRTPAGTTGSRQRQASARPAGLSATLANHQPDTNRAAAATKPAAGRGAGRLCLGHAAA
jgi:hypothetical protein